jgi:ankyrin repeat protein
MNQNLQDAYNQLNDIIKERQTFENKKEQQREPYISHKYDLELMSLSDLSQAEKGKIYLSENPREYYVKGMSGSAAIPPEIDLTNLATKLNNPSFRTDILVITSKAGHTLSHKTTLNYRDANGRTLLELAIALGDKEKVVELYEKGARISGGPKTPKALESALKFGHYEIAKYLYNQGEDAKTVSLCDIKGHDCREWFIALLRDNIKNVAQTIQCKTTFFDKPVNKFFVPDSLFKKDDEKSLFDRIAELGDANLLEDLLATDSSVKYSFVNDYDVEESMLTHAAGNNHKSFIRWVLTQRKEDINANKKFLGSAVLAASKTNNLDALDFLIAKGGDINSRGDRLRTPLLDATLSGHLDVVKYLISKNADLSVTDTHGFNLLHHAVVGNNPDVIQLLLKQSNTSELLNSKNIYGMTPLDFAIDKNYTTAIKLLDPNRETPDQQSSSFIPINQGSVMTKMRYYLASQYRDLSFFSEGGHCNGFSFLRDMYANRGDYYYHTLKLMSNWDGTQEALEKPFDKSMPQAKYYKNLGELFEQWINDITWFQHSTLGELYPDDVINAGNREFHCQVMGKDDRKPVCIANSGYERMDISRFHENIEIFSRRMPSGMRLEIRGSSHATSAFINDKKQFSYYDPNFTHIVPPIDDPVQFTKIVIDTKIIALKQISKLDEEFGSSMYFFYYDDPQLAKIIEEHEAFTDKELPRSKQEAEQFQELSPNSYTHLHVAVLSGSIASVKKILSLGFIDVNAKNKAGVTALEIAINSNNEKVIDQILMTYNASNRADYVPFLAAYDKRNQKLIDILLHHHDKINFTPIFFKAIRCKDDKLVKQCLFRNIIDVNIIENRESALIVAMRTGNPSMVELLLQQGASFFTTDLKDLSDWSSPLKNLVTCSQEVIEVALTHFQDIDQADDYGKSLIHYLNFADESAQKLIISKLVEKKANLLKSSSKGETLFDIIEDDSFFREDQKLKLYKFIVPNIKFDINNLKEQETVKRILISAIKAKDNELINSILPNVGSDILNSYIDNDVPLLQFACAHSNQDIIKKLIEKGADINCTSITRQNSCLHILVKKELHDIIQIFLEKGANIHIKNKDGKSALDLANESDSEQIRSLFQGSMCTSSQINQRPGS